MRLNLNLIFFILSIYSCFNNIKQINNCPAKFVGNHVDNLRQDTTLTKYSFSSDTSMISGWFNGEAELLKALFDIEYYGIPHYEVEIKNDTIKKFTFEYRTPDLLAFDSLKMSHIFTEHLCVDPKLLKKYPISEWNSLVYQFDDSILMNFSVHPNNSDRKPTIEIIYSLIQ